MFGGNPSASVKTVLLDLDGVVYRGPSAIAGAPDAIERLRSAEVQVLFVTNNASRTAESVAAHLTRLGIGAPASAVVTSAEAAAGWLQAQLPAGSRVLVVGGEGLRQSLADVGLVSVSSSTEHPDAVVQGFSPDLDWRLLAEGAYALSHGVPWVATNLDQSIPTERGTAPGNGTLVDALAAATGRTPTVVTGKPFGDIMELALKRSKSAPADALVVGDRLDTDIQAANLVGCPSVAVLTGISGSRDLLLAPPECRPTWIVQDLTQIDKDQVAVVRNDVGWSCGGANARVESGRIVVSDSGEDVDRIKVACAATWQTGLQDPDLAGQLQG